MPCIGLRLGTRPPQSKSTGGHMSEYDHLEFRHLKYILAIAELCSFTAASLQVHVTQSAISTQIRQIEDVYGIQIFSRDRDGVSLTPYGEILLAYARDLLQARADLIDMLKALRLGEITPLKFGFSSLVEKSTLGSVIETTRRLFSHCEILSDGDEVPNLESRIRGGDLDGALVTLPIEQNSDLTACIVERQRLFVCMRSDDPLADQDSIPAHALNGKLGLFIYPAVHPAAHRRMIELLNDIGIVPKKCNPTTNREHIQWMVQERQCYALARSGAKLLPGLTLRPIYGADLTIDTALILRANSQHPALALLIREFRKQADQVSYFQTAKKSAVSERISTVKVGRRQPKSRAESLPLFEAS